MASQFERTIRLAIDRNVSPEAAKAFLIKRARAGLAEFMARQSVRPMVSIEVDGRDALSETEVKPFGVITYRFSRMREVVSFALRELERMSPIGRGTYRRSWIVIVGVEQVGLDQIDARLARMKRGGTVTIVNTVPYARKIHVGAKGFVAYANPGIVEKARQLVLRRYKNAVPAHVRFINLSNGYILQKGRKAGQAISYPALVLESF